MVYQTRHPPDVTALRKGSHKGDTVQKILYYGNSKLRIEEEKERF
jgi:hypothetical protein